MKLAEALQERADLSNKIDQLRYRLCNNVTVQEGEQPAENPEELLFELNTTISRLEYLVAHINLTNCTIKADGKTLTEIIAEKDSLVKKHSIFKEVVETASNISNRATRSESFNRPIGRLIYWNKDIMFFRGECQTHANRVIVAS